MGTHGYRRRNLTLGKKGREMKIAFYYSANKHPRGQWIVKFDGGYTRPSRTWRYRTQKRACARFNQLREKYPDWPFSVLGFHSEPDPAAPRVATTAKQALKWYAPAIAKEFEKDSALYAMLSKGVTL